MKNIRMTVMVTVLAVVSVSAVIMERWKSERILDDLACSFQQPFIQPNATRGERHEMVRLGAETENPSQLQPGAASNP